MQLIACQPKSHNPLAHNWASCTGPSCSDSSQTAFHSTSLCPVQQRGSAVVRPKQPPWVALHGSAFPSCCRPLSRWLKRTCEMMKLLRPLVAIIHIISNHFYLNIFSGMKNKSHVQLTLQAPSLLLLQ